MTGLGQDLRYGLRQLARAPGFAAVAALTLALGIGANSAMFSVVNAALLRPLPYPDPASLVSVRERRPDGTRSLVAFPNFADWRTEQRGIGSLVAYREQSFNLGGRPAAERASGALVSADFLRVLGVEPALGRQFGADEDRPGHDAVAIISQRLWQRRFAGAPDVVGRAVTLDGAPVTVIGVTPAGFGYPAETDVWVPISRDIPALLSSRGLHAYEVLARLAPGETPVSARARLGAVATRLGEAYPATNRGWDVEVQGLQAALVGRFRPTLLMLLGAVGFVLLIAATNVANMTLARATVRRHELSIRTALGASQGRLMRQLLIESLLLALLGGALGLLLATWGVDGLLAFGPEGLARGPRPALDGPVVVFTLGVSVLSSVIFGLLPALQAARRDPHVGLRLDGRGGRERRHTSRILIVAEIALSLLLLVGAGLMVRSLSRLQAADAGFRSEGVITARVSMSRSEPDTARVIAFYQDVVQRLRALPGVTAAAAVSYLPLGHEGASYRFQVDGGAPLEQQLRPRAEFFAVSPGYFATLGIPLLQGRDVGSQDRWDSPASVIINATMARQFWPGQSPIGRRITFGETGDDDWLTVIGVVADVKQGSLVDEARPQMYAPQSQTALEEMALLVRTGADPAQLPPAIRQVVRSLDPDVPVSEFRLLDDIRSASLSTDRFRTILLGAFAGLALLLAAVGVYGVISYGVTQQSREIGIRMALGARRAEILRLVLGEGMLPVAVGLVVGVLAAAALSRFLGSLLYAVAPLDPSTFAAMSAVLTVVALAACLLPARRATRVDPVRAIRSE